MSASIPKPVLTTAATAMHQQQCRIANHRINRRKELSPAIRRIANQIISNFQIGTEPFIVRFNAATSRVRWTQRRHWAGYSREEARPLQRQFEKAVKIARDELRAAYAICKEKTKAPKPQLNRRKKRQQIAEAA